MKYQTLLVLSAYLLLVVSLQSAYGQSAGQDTPSAPDDTLSPQTRRQPGSSLCQRQRGHWSEGISARSGRDSM